MTTRLRIRSPLVSVFSAFAVVLVTAAGLTACGKSEEKPAPPSVSGSGPAGEPAKAPAAKPGAPATTTAAPPAAAADPGIGRVDSLDGDVRIVRAGAENRAETGAQIREGDTIKVGTDAWALLGMSDGASITVRPDSELRLNQYRYAPEGEASQNSAVMSLVTGAMRSITGYIGRTNRGGYRVETPTATIGIRGTDHEPAYYPPPPPGVKAAQQPGTYDKVNEGEAVIRRPTGEVSIKRGQTAFAHSDVKIRPQLLAAPPAFYQRHAQVDQRAAPRRAEFNQRYEREQQRLQQERALKKAQEQRKDDKQQGKDDKKQGKDDKKQGKDDKKQDKDAKKQARDEKKQEQRKDEKKQAKEEKKAAREEKKQERKDEKKQAEQKGAAGLKDGKAEAEKERREARERGKKAEERRMKQSEQRAPDEQKGAFAPAERAKGGRRGEAGPAAQEAPQPKGQPLPQQQKAQPRQKSEPPPDQGKKKGEAKKAER